jgi:hypothetical protein
MPSGFSQKSNEQTTGWIILSMSRQEIQVLPSFDRYALLLVSRGIYSLSTGSNRLVRALTEALSARSARYLVRLAFQEFNLEASQPWRTGTSFFSRLFGAFVVSQTGCIL